ncbi:MAG: GAF domain-containing protein [Chloroflexi bacterium]|nr:MAG: GAF domain-containing protein [Chloroflexota bacterium]TMD47176.1 MAG: GAF domain-containing protein [Chloroflexota bacterium]
MSHQEVGMSSNRVSSTGSMDHQSTSSSTTEPVELHQQVSELQAALEAQTRENALLNEVISTVCSTLKLDEVLRHLVDTIIRAISCHAAFIYLYEKEKDRLVLASTSAQYQRLVGKIELALGEGINGWVGMTMQPVILKDEAMNDPRFRYYPELEEEKFQSIMSVPIIAKDRHLIGVITLHTAAPHEFTEQDQTFVMNTAALVAGAIENAQLYENTQRKLNILTTLSVLSQTISSSLYLDEMLRSLATLTVQIMEADQCVIMLLDQARGRLTVRASSPNLTERALSFQSVDVDRNIWEKLRDYSAPAMERLNPLKDSQQKVLLSVPLVAGAEHLGLLNVYSSNTRRYTSEDSTLLGTIANQIAMAIKNSHLVDMLAQKNLVKGFFDDLMYGTYDSEDALRQRANFIGCDLSKTHTVTMIEIMHMDEESGEESEQLSDTGSKSQAQSAPQTEEDRLALHKRITGQVRRRIQDSYPGSVLYERENLLTCIICLSKDPTGSRLKTTLRDLARQMRTEHGIRMSIGVGNPCQQISDYRRGFAEATEALQMGQNLNRDGGVTHFNDLGVYRYLYKIARMDDLRDMYQDQVAHIANYDRRKGTDLLDTLETYLECAGNLTKTSNRLFVHRNTLIQRLERLQSLCEIDLQERSNWLTLQVAIKVYKLRSNRA